MRRVLFTLVCLIGCLQLAANPVTLSLAQQKASQFLNKRVAKQARASAPKAKALKMMAVGRDDSYYIFNIGDNDGFVVVSGEDATEDILGYSDSGSINPDSMPCGMRMLLDNYAEQIKFLRDNGITREQNQSVRKIPALTSYHIDEERLAKYDQGEPYNNLCPFIGDERAATGCAATAMAELMYYYSWPSQTTSEIPGYISETKELHIESIPANTSIDWGNIIKQYNTYYIIDVLDIFPHRLWDTDDQANAIANLMKMSGASVHMDYNESSSAVNYNIPYALMKYFGYETANIYYRNSFTAGQWNEKLCNELLLGKPIIYYGNGSEGGHFFMLEGYRYEDDDYFYDINFGWDGRKNDYFLLTTIKGELTYVNNQAAVLDVKPQSTLAPVDMPLKLFVDELEVKNADVYSRPTESSKFESITLSTHVWNKSPIDAQFNYGFAFKNGAIVDDYFSDKTLELGSALGTSGNLTFSCGSKLTDGKYTIVAISKEVSAEVWQINDNSDQVFVEAVVCNDKLALKSTEAVPAQLRIGELVQTSEATLRVGQPSEFKFTIVNDASPTIYDGGILIKDAETDNVIFIDKVQMTGSTTTQKTFTFTPAKAGDQELIFLNKRWEPVGSITVNAISATASLDLLEVTELTLKDGDVSRRLIDGTTLRGTLYMKNNDAVTKKANITIGLTDVETQAVKTKPVSVTIDPNSTVGYSFSFSNLTDGHHYVITASYASGEEFYRSAQLLCTTAGMGETELGNEALAGYEYWFDDNVNGRQWVGLSGNDAVIRASIDTHGLSGGLHRFNFRLKRSDGAYSAVTSSTFLNMKAESEGRIVYWFDDKIDQTASVPIADTENEQEVTLDLQDTEKFPMGFHQLNMRVATPGKSLSNVYSARVLKMASGEADQMEYWIDGDYEHTRKTVSGHVASYNDKYMLFTNPFDLSDVSEGLHRIYYRATSSNGLTNTAVSMTPVMVKSKYEQEYTDPRILGYSIAVDNEEPKIREFGTPKSELEMSHILDARTLSTGKHTVKAKFWNTAYAGVSVEQQFNVSAPVIPTLTLTATEQGGLVNLKFDAVPNDLRYRTIRVDANGAKVKIDGREGSSYPATISFNDNPAAGTYTYYVQTVYTDNLGERHTLNSNEVTVTIAEPQTEVIAIEEYGYITGRIVCDKNTPLYGLKVQFSDGVTTNVNGTNFGRTRIPAGTELTMTVIGDDTHEYEQKTVTVRASANGATNVTIQGTLREDFQPNNLANDLCINSPLDIVIENERYYARFKVKNLSHDNDWQGIIRVKVIDKKKADKQEGNLATASFEEENLYIGESGYVTIGYNATKEVNIFLKKLKVKKDTEFYFYLESQGKWADSEDAEENKPIAPNSRFDVAENPIVKTIGKTDQSAPKWDSDAKETFAYLMVGLSSVTPGMDGQVGDLSPFETKVIKATGKRNAKEACAAILEWWEGKSALEAINDPNLYNVSSAVKGVYDDISDAIVPPLTQRFWKNIVGAAADVATADLMIDEVVQIATAVTSNDTFEQSMACANILYTALASNSGAVPLSSMMYTYMVVGKSLIDAARSFAPIMNSRYIVTRMKANKPYNGGSENRQNSAVDFKLVVQTKTWFGHKAIDFTKRDASKQIQSISIKAAHQQGQEPAEFSFTPVFKKDCVMLRSDGRGITNNRHLDDMNELSKFYMEINWANGRQSQIPLNMPTNGVDISFDGVHVQSDSDYEAEKPVVYTVTLTTTTGKDKMADELYLGTNKNRE